MRSADHDRRMWWRVGAVAASVAALACLAVLAWFFAGQGREKSNQWASILALPVAWLAAAVPLVVWMVRQAGRSHEPDGAAVVRLRQAVARLWGDEVAARELHLPRPLRLRWRPTSRSGVQVNIADAGAGTTADGTGLPGGALLQDDDARPPALALAEAFRDTGVRQLVVLGEPGAGKTTLAILYAVAAATTAQPDGDEPVPVPLPLAGWDPTPEGSLEDWIVGRICQDYPRITPADAERLVRDRKVIPVLDGLDEMPAALRVKALTRLERAAGAGLRMMLTCRSNEFAQATGKVGVLPQAVVVDVKPVDVGDAVTYLTQREAAGSTRWDRVTASMTTTPDGPVAAALSTPLMIALARQVYQSPRIDPTELLTLATPDAVQERLLDRFLPSVYGERADRAGRWLALLVRHLPADPRDPNLAWWRLARAVPRPVLTALVTVTVTVLGALSGPLVAFAAFGTGAHLLVPAGIGGTAGLVVGLMTGLSFARAAHALRERPGRLAWFRTAATGLADVCVAAATVSALGAVLLIGMYLLAEDVAAVASIRVVDVLQFPPLADPTFTGPALLIAFAVAITVVVPSGLHADRAGTPRRSTPRLGGLPRRLVSGLTVGLLFGLPWTVLGAFHLLNLTVTAGLGITLVIAGLIGVPLGLGRWLSAPVSDRQDSPSPGSSLRGDRTALLVAVTGVAVAAALATACVVLIVGNGAVNRRIIVLVIAVAAVVAILVLFGSGSAWLSYTTARLWLAFRGRLPWRLTRFLDQAHRAGVLRQAGRFYQIRHDLVRVHLTEHWAPPAQQEGAASPGGAAEGPDQPEAGARRRPRTLGLVATTIALTLLPAVALAADPRSAPRATLGPSGASDVQFSSDGHALVTSGPAGVARVWSTAAGKLAGSVRIFPQDHVLMLGPEGRTLVTTRVSEEGLRLWNTGTGKLVARIDRFERRRGSMWLSADGNTVVTMDRNGEMWLWSASTGEFIARLHRGDPRLYQRWHRPEILTLPYAGTATLADVLQRSRNDRPESNPTPQAVISRDRNGIVRVQNAGRPTATLDRVEDNDSVVFSPDGHTLATISWNQVVRLWDLPRS